MKNQKDAATCPECGGKLQIVTDGLVGVLTTPAWFIVGRSQNVYVMKAQRFAACTACEYCRSF